MSKAAASGMGSGERIIRRIRVPLGFAFAAAFLVLARPSLGSLARSLVLVIPGLWLRGYAAGYVKKNAELTTTGPYNYTRNPLYLGSFAAALGFVASSREPFLVLGFLILFAGIYLPVIRSEERFLAAHFHNFQAYMAEVPRLFPRSFPPRSSRARQQPATAEGLPGSFSAELYRKHREYNAAIGALGIYGALLLLLWFRQHS